MSDADQLRRLLLERSVRRGDFVLSSGQRSSYYIDCRLSTMSAEGQVLIGRMGLTAIIARGRQPAAVIAVRPMRPISTCPSALIVDRQSVVEGKSV